jgi:UDP-N-acetylglucosamine--N-acetylmuramyl-(pentapeptide) pyrophosphoryl-undecaprenol N-acetylglucosamine transferase
MIMAGGTGGHVFPALAVANYLREIGENVIWLGTHAGIEAQVVPEAGIEIEWLSIHGVRGKNWLTKALAPFKILQASWQARSIIKKHQPRAVLGMGGFVSGPGGLMAWLSRIPLIVHEQNAVIGLTNKLLSRFARVNFFAFPSAAKNISRSQIVGNPVRKDILQIEQPAVRYQPRLDKSINLLIIGGSLGAQSLNEALPAGLSKLAANERPAVRHQTGRGKLEGCKKQYQKNGIEAEVTEFIEDMKSAYEWADLVICRSGALTVSELAAAGVASILVPYPYHVDDQQFHNALFLVHADAAVVCRDADFDTDFISGKLQYFSQHKSELLKMAERARAIAYTRATELVAEGILKEAES